MHIWERISVSFRGEMIVLGEPSVVMLIFIRR